MDQYYDKLAFSICRLRIWQSPPPLPSRGVVWFITTLWTSALSRSSTPGWKRKTKVIELGHSSFRSSRNYNFLLPVQRCILSAILGLTAAGFWHCCQYVGLITAAGFWHCCLYVLLMLRHISESRRRRSPNSIGMLMEVIPATWLFFMHETVVKRVKPPSMVDTFSELCSPF